MKYVEVAIADQYYHGKLTLTYKTDLLISIGDIVAVPIKNKNLTGIVIAFTNKPEFSTKLIIEKIEYPPLPIESIELLKWMQKYYSSSIGSISKLFLPSNINKIHIDNMNATIELKNDLPKLTLDQQKILKKISTSGLYLLHGDTGSGKTRVYIELAKKSIENNKSVLILTPEISLTPQLENNFEQSFKNIKIVHSKLTSSKRLKVWAELAVNKDKPMILIGPRSALFYPLHNIGLIVIDEAHETAYKQDSAPYYHAIIVASKLAQIYDSKIILGSATPQVSDYYIIKSKKRPVLRMTETALNNSTETITKPIVVDLKDRQQFTRDSHLSNILLKSISDTLSKNEQVLLFLNRRGTARVIICNVCGWQALCPNCDLPLIYHGDTHQLRCHSCAYKIGLVSNCPICSNSEIILKSIGTKAVYDSVRKFFPDVKALRIDSDNKRSEGITEHFEEIVSGEIKILVGTQTLAKGLDLPKLGLVGTIIADTSMYFPDFSSQERTFQLLTQVMGRVNRGHRLGNCIIQTYNPKSFIIESVINKDWQSFYRNEIKERENYLFPPFCYLLKLSCLRSSRNSAISSIEKFKNEIKKFNLRLLIEGPAPSFHEKNKNKYEWQLIIKSKNRDNLLKIIEILPSGWKYDIDPMNLL